MAILGEFKKFVLRGSLVDMAVGFTVGAAFATVAQSLVSDVLMPPVGLVLGRADFSDQFVLLRAGSESAPPYATLAEAQAAGAVTLNYGLFLNRCLALLVVAVVMFLVIRAVNRVEERLERQATGQKKAEEPANKKCRFCLSTVPFRAVRCPACTSMLEAEVAVEP